MNGIHVKIAEVKVGQEKDVLKSVLGSCVGIVFIWREKKICGLAHCLLPETNTDEKVMGAKYVNQAINSLMTLMDIRPSDTKHIEVYLAGGGNMMNQLMKLNSSQIGHHNAEAAMRYLAKYGFKVTKAVLGSHSGTKVQVNCDDLSVEISHLEDLSYYAKKA